MKAVRALLAFATCLVTVPLACASNGGGFSDIEAGAGDDSGNKTPETGGKAEGGDAGCTGGLMMCAGSCVNTQTDMANCGKCSNPCTGDTSCSGGMCKM